MSDVGYAVLGAILAPVAIVTSVAIFKGYHVLLHIYRPEKKKKED